MSKSTPVDDYIKMKLNEQLNYYKRVANYSESFGNRGRLPGVAATEMMTGQSINPPTIQLTQAEIRERELAQHLKEYKDIQAEYTRREKAVAAAAAAAEAAAAGPKSPKSPKSP